MTLPVPAGSKDDPGHVHQWKRWRTVTFTIRYTCTGCGTDALMWPPEAGGTVEDIDRLVAEKCGGVFGGEIGPDASFPRRVLRTPII